MLSWIEPRESGERPYQYILLEGAYNVKIAVIVGTRPQIIKSVPIIYQILKKNLNLKIIHTGQHYDELMSDVFFKTFSISKPNVNLGVGSGSQGYQVGEMIVRLEKVLMKDEPNIVIVPGDTNSALASAITVAKLRIPLAHVEAGARCYDMKMQEEINRRIIDHVSSFLFAVSQNCVDNLMRENVLGEVIFSGDTMYEVYEMSSKKIAENDIVEKLDFKPKEYAVLTLHREENVENADKLLRILKAVTSIGIKVVFPIHPRTKRKLREFKVHTIGENLMIIDPLDYFSMMKLVKESALVFTDSGGLQKEAFWSKVPCITLREKTEWIETMRLGVNFLAGANEDVIVKFAKRILQNLDEFSKRFKNIENPYVNGDIKPSKAIVDTIRSLA